MLIAHAPLAVLSSHIILKKELSKERFSKQILFLLISCFIAILPDFDIFYLASKNIPAFNHHLLVTHTPFFWICVFIILKALAYILKDIKVGKVVVRKKDLNIVVNIGIVAIFSHLFADLILGHIALLYPFSNQTFSLLSSFLPINLFAGYLGHPIFALELIIVSITVVYLLKNIFGFKHLISLMIIPLSFLYLIFNISIYTQTYQFPPVKNSYGSPLLDKDNDRLMDYYDMDVGNDGRNNYEKVEKRDITFYVDEVISKDKKIVSSEPNNIYNIVLKAYGGLTVERIVQLAYIKVGYPISPVIYDYMYRNNIEKFSEGFVRFVQERNDGSTLPGSIVVRNDKIGIIINGGQILQENDNNEVEIIPL